MKKGTLQLFVVLLTTVLLASFGFAAGKKSFHAKFTGKAEIPSVTTKAKGEVKFKLTKDGTMLHYKMTVKNIENATAAHIHLGKKGVSGPPVVNLFTGPKKEGIFSGALSEGTISDKDLMGDLQGKPLGELVKLFESGDAYVNVHNDAHPDGEIRGQVK